MLYSFKDFRIIATVNINTLLTPLVKEAVETAINYQIEEFQGEHFGTNLEPSELTVIIVPFLDDYLIMIKANDPASDMMMTDSLNAWIQVLKEERELFGEDD